MDPSEGNFLCIASDADQRASPDGGSEGPQEAAKEPGTAPVPASYNEPEKEGGARRCSQGTRGQPCQ